jgi:arginine-tRNA-protein transferase
MEPACCTAEKFELYKKYQIAVHKDPESKLQKDGFTRFLCDGPLQVSHFLAVCLWLISPQPERSGDPAQPYGQFHQLYRLDGKLIAFGVLDILPTCCSSVYFVWDPDYSALSLGKVRSSQVVFSS